MAKDWTLTKEGLDKLLTWLNNDRELAGEKYADIRDSLIRFFVIRCCVEAEDLADEVIDRVIRKVDDLVQTYKGDPALFFLGVARRVLLEYKRKAFTLSMRFRMNKADAPDSEDELNEKEARLECLDSSLQQMSPENREMILYYYQKNKQEKIDHRKELADRMGISVNTLRVRVHRQREFLLERVIECLERRGRE